MSIEFEIGNYNEKKYQNSDDKAFALNSNFIFKEDENTKYAKTSTGEKLPFKLFNANDSGGRSNILWENGNQRESSDFALIERRFTEFRSLEFLGNEKINNINDVAWLFKALEDEAVEHAFLVYHFANKSYFVQHISTGVFNAALVSNNLLTANILKANPESVTLVHNHPSGNLKVSNADRQCIKNLKKALEFSNIEVNLGVIVNLRSGKYTVFDDNNFDNIETRKNLSDNIPIQIYSFSKQILVDNFQPIKVKNSEDVAKYITSQKFGVADKTEMLIVDTQLNIVGKFLIPAKNQVDFIIDKVTNYGGSNCIIYGNNISPEEINYFNSRLKHTEISILDGILFKSNNAEKVVRSMMDEGILDISQMKYQSTTNLSDNYEIYNSKKHESGIIGGKLKDIAKEEVENPGYLETFDLNTQKTIQKYINNQNPKKMETQKDFDQVEYLKAQFRYLGFGENEKLHKDLEQGLNSPEKSFVINTTSDKTLPDNNIEFSINFSKSDKGGVFLNSYDAKLTNAKGEEISQNFKVSKENYFTAKEAINLLEGRAVKIEFNNPKTEQRESAFVKLNLASEKNQWGRYDFQSFHQNFGVDTGKIVEASKLIFDKPEYRENTIKSLEKGNVVKVKFELDDKVIEGKAVLNPQYKNLNLYDSDMNRLNTNKPLQGVDNDNRHDKSNVREQSISRGI